MLEAQKVIFLIIASTTQNYKLLAKATATAKAKQSREVAKGDALEFSTPSGRQLTSLELHKCNEFIRRCFCAVIAHRTYNFNDFFFIYHKSRIKRAHNVARKKSADGFADGKLFALLCFCCQQTTTTTTNSAPANLVRTIILREP